MKCICLDTNFYILGAADPNCAEAQILRWVGFGEPTDHNIDVVLSDAIFDQIARVAKRLQGKDWSGELISRIWQDVRVRYVMIDRERLAGVLAEGVIPREDATVYLTALTALAGEAECLSPRTTRSSKRLLPHAANSKVVRQENSLPGISSTRIDSFSCYLDGICVMTQYAFAVTGSMCDATVWKPNDAERHPL